MISYEEYAVLLRNDFSTFIHRSFQEVSPGDSYHHNWHIDLIASKLEACRRGEIKRLIINIPPRNLKSICASIAFPAWILGHNPATEIIAVSYGQDLSEKLARDCRRIMDANWYQQIFPTRIDATRRAISDYTTTHGGSRLATSVGGVLTGRGGDFLIIDDPLKPDDAFSESRRRQVNEWYQNTLYSRLNDKRKGCIIIIMQRLHEDDLVGHVLEMEDWEVLRLPAIAEEDEYWEFSDLLGRRQIKRRAGVALHPERESLKALEILNRTLGDYNFAGQYQQSPAPAEGGIIKRDWFLTYTTKPERFDCIVQSWDTASKSGELNDYCVCTTWGVTGKKYYLLDVFRKKMEFPELRREALTQRDKWRPQLILIEDKSSGTQLIQDLRAQGETRVTAISPEGDKTMRLYSRTAVLESGAVLLPETAPWRDLFLHEVTTFPGSRHDDQTDSMTQFLIWAGEYANRPVPRIRSL